MGELGFQGLIARHEIDIVRRGGQGLQLAGGRAAGPTHIVDPQPLVVGERVIELDCRREVRIVMRHVDIFGCIQAVEIHELDARAQVDVQFCILDAVSSRYPVGVGGELIGIAEELVEGRIFLERTVEIIGVVDGGTLVI